MKDADGVEEDNSLQDKGDGYDLGFMDAVCLIWYKYQELKNNPNLREDMEQYLTKIHVSIIRRRYKKISEIMEGGLLVGE